MKSNSLFPTALWLQHLSQEGSRKQYIIVLTFCIWVRLREKPIPWKAKGEGQSVLRLYGSICAPS